MKSRVPKAKNVKDIANSGIVLSIGMIVKNEHKHIGNCLNALKPLMEAVPSELIIADTGSTDDTFEICKQFTDKVFHFEWINDFAAARNSTLALAKGIWFMFIDADEYLDKDISAMVNFFTNPGNKHLCATYVIRNYDYGSSLVTNFPAPRIARNLPSVKFIGKIHESLDVPNEFYNLPTVAHHYGYVYQTAQEREVKWKRNRDLMLTELDEKPNDVRLLVHLVDVSQGETKEEYVFKALEILKKENYSAMSLAEDKYTQNQMYRGRAFIAACIVFAGKDFEKVYEYSKEYFSLKQYLSSYGAIDMYIFLAQACVATKRYDEAIEAYAGYFEVYDKFKKGTLENFDSPVLSLFNASEQTYLTNKCNYIVTLSESGQFDKSHEILETINIDDIALASYENFCIGINAIMSKTKKFERYVPLYRNVIMTNDSYKIEKFVEFMGIFYRKNPQDRSLFIKSLAETNANDVPFVRVMQLLQRDINKEDITADLNEYFSSIKDIRAGQTEAIYLAIKHKVYFPQLLNHISYTGVQSLFKDLFELHPSDYTYFVIEYCDYEHFTANISGFFWAVTMLYYAVKQGESLPPLVKTELYEKFTNLLADFVYNVYNPELLNNDDVEVLPPLHRFGFYMGKAKNSLKENDPIGYVRALKDGLILCEEMRDLVAVSIKDFQEKYMARRG